MKKLFAVLLTMVMLLTSVAAMAESIPTTGIELKDIVLKQDGEIVADLSGLSLKLAAGTDETEDNAVFTAGVYGGDQKAMSALAAFTQGKVVASVEGMSKPLTLDLSDGRLIGLLTEMMSESERAGMMKVQSAVTALTSDETLMNLLMNYAAYQESVNNMLTANMTAEENVPTEFLMADGEQNASIITITITGENMVELMKGARAFYDSEPAILDLVNGLMLLSGEDEIPSFAAILDDATIEEMYNQFDMIVTVYANDDGSLMDLDISLYDDLAAAEPEFLGGAVLAYSLTETLDVKAVVMDNYGTDVTFGLSMYESETAPGEMEYDFYGEYTEDGQTTTLLNGWVGPDPDLGTLGNITINPDSEYDAAGFAWSFDDTSCSFNVYDNYNDMTIAASEGNTADEINLYFGYEEYGTLVEIECVLAAITGEVDAAELNTLAAADGIDVLNITEEDLNNIINELTMPAMGALGVLSQNVPGLAPILGF